MRWTVPVQRQDGTENPASRPPTIRELLTHTAGFSYNFIRSWLPNYRISELGRLTKQILQRGAFAEAVVALR